MTTTEQSLAGVYLRLGAAVLALAAGGAAVVTIALLLHRTPGPAPSSAGGAIAPTSGATVTATSSTPVQTVAAPRTTNPAAVATPASPDFPAPPRGAVVFSREDGSNAVGLALLPGNGRLRLQASVVGPSGSGVRGLPVEFRVDSRAGGGSAVRSTPCGAGCYEAQVVWRGRPARVLVRLGDRPLAFGMPATWPPRPAARLVARAGRVWRKLQTLVSHERLASDPQHTVTTLWSFVAPDRLSYRIAHGASAIVMGGRRWDRVPGGRWQASPQQPLRQPVPYWAGVTDAYVLGTRRIGGHSARLVSFFDPKTPAWFTIAIDAATLRTLDLRMVTTSHFMHDVYGPFNRPLSIRPPQR